MLQSDALAGLICPFQEAIERLQRYKSDEVQKEGGCSSMSILLNRFSNIMLLMQIAVAVVSSILERPYRFPKDALAMSARGLRMLVYVTLLQFFIHTSFT